jgi:glycosyltransferase involved in cell wall biosynthesis
VDRVLAGSDIVCLTSWNEGTPVSLIEAQAAGRAIVTTQVGGVENVVAEGKTALLCAPGDTAKFAEHLSELIGNAEKRRAFGDAGWPVVSERFHYTRLTTDMAQLYRLLLSRK